MSQFMEFIEYAKRALSPAEWEFFSARYIHGDGLGKAVTPGSQDEALRISVLRKLRAGISR